MGALNKEDRAYIRDRIISHAFNAKIEAARNAMYPPALTAVALAISPDDPGAYHEIAIDKKKGGRTVPFLSTAWMPLSAVYYQVDSKGHRLPISLPMPYKLQGNPVFVTTTPEIEAGRVERCVSTLLDLQEAYDSLIAEKIAKGNSVEGVLEALRTYKRLIAEWPEVEPLIPGHVRLRHESPATTGQLPVPLQGLNSALGLPPSGTEDTV